MNNIDEIITLDNRDFLIVNRIEHEGIKYLYVIANDKTEDIALLEEIESEGQIYVQSVDDDNRFKTIMSLIANDYIEQ